MELLGPSALGLLALLLPLVLLYILKIQRKRRAVASTWLWQQAKRDLMARSPFRRLVVQLPLILQACALIVLALAAARPATRGKTISGDHIAIIVDTSASMSARDQQTGKTRIALAKTVARELVRSLPPGSDAMILDAGRDPPIAFPADPHTPPMHTAINAITARHVEGDLGAAIGLAVSRLSQQGGRRQIYVVTDGNLARAAPLKSTAVPIELISVGHPTDNAAIVRVDVRAGEHPVLKRDQVQAFLLIANYGKRARELYVTMKQRNASDTLASRKVLVKPGQKLPVVLTFNPAPGDYGTGLSFDISPHDAMPVDDVAFGRVPAGRALPVYYGVDGDPDYWLLKALAADRDADVRRGSVGQLLASRAMPHDAFVIVQGACPVGIGGGDLLVIDPPPGDCFGTMVGAPIEGALMTSWREKDDARLKWINRIEYPFVGKARLLRASSKRQELMRTDKGVVVTDISSNARYATLLGFAPGETAWPKDVGFVLFVRNLLEQARLHRSTGISGPARAGQPLRAAVPIAVKEVVVERPDGKKSKVVARKGLAVVPDVQQVGLYLLSWSAPQAGAFITAVNLASAAESDLTRTPKHTASASLKLSHAERAMTNHREHSWLLAILALIFIVFDVWYLTRRPRKKRLTEAAPAGAATGKLTGGQAS